MLDESQVLRSADGGIVGLLTTAQAAAYIGYTQRMLESRRVRGDGPPFVRISARAVRYRLDDIKTWIADRIKHPLPTNKENNL